MFWVVQEKLDSGHSKSNKGEQNKRSLQFLEATFYFDNSWDFNKLWIKNRSPFERRIENYIFFRPKSIFIKLNNTFTKEQFHEFIM